MKFLYPQLGAIDEKAPRAQRLGQLAQVMTNERNGRLSRTIVNRVWQRLMGRAIVEPVDEMDNPPWNGDLLDALAWQFSHGDGYDLKKTIERIVMSRAYQSSAMPISEEAKDYVFAGPGFKKLTAEQFADAVSTLTGTWPAKQDATLSDAGARYAKTKWIWSDKNAATATAPDKVYFRRIIDMKGTVDVAMALAAADNEFTLYVNGKKAGSGDSFAQPTSLDLKPYLKPGKNVLAAVVTNTSDQPNPAGFWFNLAVRYELKEKETVATRTSLNTDATWKWSKAAPPADAWSSAVDFDESKWGKAVAVGDTNAAPWMLGDKL